MPVFSARHRWWFVAAVISLLFIYASRGLGWDRYAASWLGAAVKAASGAALGWFLSRYVCKIDLSAMDPEARAIAGLAQAFLIGSCAVAVAFGV